MSEPVADAPAGLPAGLSDAALFAEAVVAIRQMDAVAQAEAFLASRSQMVD